MSDNEKVGVGVGTGVSVRTGVFVGLGVGIDVAVPVGVTVGVFVGVAVPVGVTVGVFVGVAVQVARTAASVAVCASRSNVIWSLNTRLARPQKTRKTVMPNPMRMVICCLVITMHQLSC